MTKARPYLNRRIFQAVALLSMIASWSPAVAQVFQLLSLPPADPAGNVLFQGTIALTNVTTNGSYFLYTSATAAALDSANNGGSFGVITAGSTTINGVSGSGCSNVYPQGTCTYVPSTPVSALGVLNTNTTGQAGTFNFTAASSYVELTGLSFGFTNNANSFYIETGNIPGSSWDLHYAGVTGGSGINTQYNSSAGGTPIMFATLLPEIDGGALAKGSLLLASLCCILKVRRRKLYVAC